MITYLRSATWSKISLNHQPLIDIASVLGWKTSFQSQLSFPEPFHDFSRKQTFLLPFRDKLNKTEMRLFECHQTTVTAFGLNLQLKSHRITRCRVVMTTFCRFISIIYNQYVLQTIELIGSKLFNERFSLRSA